MIAADLQNGLEMAPDPTLVVDRRVRIMAASASAALLCGRSCSELRGLPVEEIVPGGVLDPEARLTVRRPDGVEFPVEISAELRQQSGQRQYP